MCTTIDAPVGPRIPRRSTKRDARHQELEVQRAGCGKLDVRQIAGVVAVDALEPVALVAGVEVIACAVERRLALAVFMDVNAVRAKSQSGNRRRDEDTGMSIIECRGADLHASEIVNRRRGADRRDRTRRRRWRRLDGRRRRGSTLHRRWPARDHRAPDDDAQPTTTHDVPRDERGPGRSRRDAERRSRRTNTRERVLRRGRRSPKGDPSSALAARHASRIDERECPVARVPLRILADRSPRARQTD